MTDDGVEMTGEKGPEILAHAYNSGYCVLEFKTRDDGTTIIMDITDHVEQLEKKVNNG
jgi:hypothetical protein